MDIDDFNSNETIWFHIIVVAGLFLMYGMSVVLRDVGDRPAILGWIGTFFSVWGMLMYVIGANSSKLSFKEIASLSAGLTIVGIALYLLLKAIGIY